MENLKEAPELQEPKENIDYLKIVARKLIQVAVEF